MKIKYLFFPFAFNGPCVTQLGPLVLEYELKKTINASKLLLIKQKFTESHFAWMKRFKNIFFNSLQSNDLVVIFGGNHLSILPIYEVTNSLGYTSITLDAHRDYNNTNNELTHGSFFRYLKKTGNLAYLIGYRDTTKDIFSYFDQEINITEAKKEKIKINNENNIFLDIDVDVFDPTIFPYTECKINNGLSYNNFNKILEKIELNKLKVLSFSEYSPYTDEKKIGIYFIESIIKQIYTKKQ